MTVDRDVEWMMLVTYARAAGAGSAATAGDWADQAVRQGQVPFRQMCERIDFIAGVRWFAPGGAPQPPPP